MAFSSSEVTIEKTGAIATLWLDRAAKSNAISDEIWRAIPAALQELAGDGEVRAIVLAGRGENFCVGLDMEAFGDSPRVQKG